MNISRSLIVRHTELDSSYIPLAYRRKVLERDKGNCHFCHRPTEYLCHDLVKCRGGQTISDNLLTCCQDCRRDKGELTAAEYRQVITLKQENIFKEVTMRIRIHFTSGRTLDGEVEQEPSLSSPFFLKVGNNGKALKINSSLVEYTEPLGGKTKQ